ncbi:MAG: hypothetical protein V3V04_05345 [Rhizobiaceae bacterium]
MPRTEHNIGRQRSTRHEITVNGLLTLRGHQLRHLRLGTDTAAKTNIAAIDRVLVNVIGYEGDISEESTDFRRVTTFKRGELRRLVAGVLRKTERPLTTLEIAKIVMATKGLEASYSRKIKSRVNNVRAVLKRMDLDKGADANGNVVWRRAT